MMKAVFSCGDCISSVGQRLSVPHHLLLPLQERPSASKDVLLPRKCLFFSHLSKRNRSFVTSKLDGWLTRLGGWMAQLDGWMAHLGDCVAQLAGWLTQLGGCTGGLDGWMA